MISLRSKITKKLLNYFFLHKSSKLYINQMTRLLKVDHGNLVRKLQKLEKEGILKSEFKGNQRYYSLNPDYPLIKEYQAIVFKTIGIEAELRSAFSRIKGIKHLYIFGSYARDHMEADSDIDILIVGTAPHLYIEEVVSRLQKKVRREINVIDFDEVEYQSKIKNDDPFIKDILENPHIKII